MRILVIPDIHLNDQNEDSCNTGYTSENMDI